VKAVAKMVNGAEPPLAAGPGIVVLG